MAPSHADRSSTILASQTACHYPVLPQAEWTISELRTHREWNDALPILISFRCDATPSTVLAARPTLLASGYRLFGLRTRTRLVTLAGVHFYPHITYGKLLWLNDLVTAEGERSKGYGSTMLHFLHEYARRSHCRYLYLHALPDNQDAHRFYRNREFQHYADVYRRAVS